MENLPVAVPVLFGLTTLLAVFGFYKAAHNSKKVLLILLLWMALQAIIGLSGFYTNTGTMPPRVLLLAGPALILIAFLFIMPAGKRFTNSLSIKHLTLLHTVRIPVELILLWLYYYHTIPQIMTFEGRNFDIVAGLTAPVVYYFAFQKKTLSRGVLLAWNFLCLALLGNIVSIAILSIPLPFQQFGFGQPNIAVLHFPFIWLPGVVVPLVLFAHLAAIRQLLGQNHYPQVK